MKNKSLKILLLSSMIILTGCNNNNSSSENKNSSDNSIISSEHLSETTSSSENSSEQNEIIHNKDKIINVYLIGGQSNAVGYGMDTNNTIANSDSRFKNGFENVLYFGQQERWDVETSNSSFEPVKLGYGVATNRSGAEIGIASAIADEDEMSAVIKCSWGATHIYPDAQYNISLTQGTWTSPSYIEENNINLDTNPLIGRMFTWFEETVTKGIDLLIEDGYVPVIKGMWWMQGEAEMFSNDMASSYEELLTYLIKDVRASVSNITGYDNSDMPFVLGLPKWNTKNSPKPAFQDKVRSSMERVCADTKMINVACVDCMPLTQHDDWHFDAQGQKYLGEKFVESLKTLNEGNSSVYNEKIRIHDDVNLNLETASLEFEADVVNYDETNSYEYGMIYVRKDQLVENDITSDYINELNENNIDYVDQKLEVVEVNIDEVYRTCTLKGSLSNIQYKDINTKYAAIAYIKDIYGDYFYSSSNVFASMSNLASKALYTESENLQVYKNYVNAGVNYKLGVHDDNKYGEANLVLECDDNITIDYAKINQKYNLNLVQNPNMGYYVKYSSLNPEIVTVDESGNLMPKTPGNASVKIECGGKEKIINVNVINSNENGVTFDGVINNGEYIGEVVIKQNSKVTLEIQGKVAEGKTYLAFKYTHGEWSPYNPTWYKNDNIEFKLDGGESHTIVFYNGAPEFSKNIDKGNAVTTKLGDKLVTTVEVCVDGTKDKYKLNVGINGVNPGWLGAIWPSEWYAHNVYVTEAGVKEKVDVSGGVVLDGEFNESCYTTEVQNNSISVNANGAQVSIMGTLLDDGVLFAVTINHKTAPGVSLGNGDWYTFMNIEFHFNGNTNQQFLATCNNHIINNGMSSYSKTIENGEGYTTTFEMFMPYESIGVASDITTIDFTCNGWVETGWCWFFYSNPTWAATHTLTVNGITTK